MDEKQVLKLIDKRLKEREAKRRFGRQNVAYHTHDGSESPRIREIDLERGPAVSGNVEFSTAGAFYTFNIDQPFTPRQITVYGTVFNNNGIGPTIRAMTFGVASLGKAFYLQPDSANSVTVGDIQYPAPTKQPDGSTVSVPIQSSTYLWTDTTSVANFRAGSSEDHVVSISFGGTIYARVTVVEFSKNKIVFSVPFLQSGYTVIANYLIV